MMIKAKVECCPNPNFFSFGPLVDVGWVSIDCPRLSLRQTMQMKQNMTIALAITVRETRKQINLKLEKDVGYLAILAIIMIKEKK